MRPLFLAMDILLELENLFRKSPVTTVTESTVLGNLIFFMKQELLVQKQVKEQVGSRGGQERHPPIQAQGPSLLSCVVVLSLYCCGG